LFQKLEEAGFEVLLVDARQAKHVPGRKSDVQDPANPIWGRRRRRIPAGNQMFGLSSPRTIEKHEKSTLRLANKGVLFLSNREARIETPVPGWNCSEGLLRSGCAALVAVKLGCNCNCKHSARGHARARH
jgi:hypothetical protein